MKLNYITFEGNREDVPEDIVRNVDKILLDEKNCIRLPEKNWLVFTDDEDEELMDRITKSCPYDNLSIETWQDNRFINENEILQEKLDQAKTLILNQAKKNAELQQENIIKTIQSSTIQ